MAANPCTIVWFRRDLRLEDNPALSAAARSGPILPVFIWSPEEEGHFLPGRVSRWWLKQSLTQLDLSLKSLGVSLIVRKTRDTLRLLFELAENSGANRVFYNHLYDPISLVRDHRVKQCLIQRGIQVQSFNGDLLYEPWNVTDDDGKPFTTFESFWQKCLGMPFEPDYPLLPPRRLVAPPAPRVVGCTLEELGLEDETEKDSNALLARAWNPGWTSADNALESFLSSKLLKYSENRQKIDGPTTSLLSPHMHFGEVSVRKVYHLVRRKQILWAREGYVPGEESVNCFLRSLGIREYSRYLCFNFPFTHERPLLSNLKSFPWRVDEGCFKAWRQGRTGYPLVDAGMRELWATGWVHNRVRVIVSSFCVKFLRLPWTWGMKYFWDTLLDADLESDVLGWQYISGSLPDGHELDRMDNPQIEGYKHDPLGEYVRRWLPELARLPTEWIHCPWDAPPAVLRAAGVELGCNYPRPIVEVAAARERLQLAVLQMWQKEAALNSEAVNREEGIEGETLGIKNMATSLEQLKGRSNPLPLPEKNLSSNIHSDNKMPTSGLQSSFAKNDQFPTLFPVAREVPQNANDGVLAHSRAALQANMTPPPASEVNSTAESCSFPKKSSIHNKSGKQMLESPSGDANQQLPDFARVLYKEDASQHQRHFFRGLHYETEVDVDRENLGSCWTRRTKHKATADC